MDQCTYYVNAEPPDEQPGCVTALAGGICTPQGPEAGPEQPAAAAGGGWWRGIVSSARAQSSHMMGFMKRDLGEFVSVVRDDTKDAVHKTAGAVRESVNKESTAAATSRLKSGLTRFLDSVTSAMTIPPDDSDEQPMVFKEGAWHVAKSRREARILTLQADRNTYETAPEDEAFEKWRDSFDADSQKGAISDLLVTNSDVRTNYTRLVPNTLLHRDFWARYFFRLEVLEREEARWEALKERATRPEAESSDWGDDWDEDSGPAAASDIPAASGEPPIPSSDGTATEQPREPQAEIVSEPQAVLVSDPPAEIVSDPPAELVSEPTAEIPVSPPLPPTLEAEVNAAAAAQAEAEFRMSERADAVVVKHKDSPESSESCLTAGLPERRDLEDWEADLDVDVTAEEIEEAKRTARELKEANQLPVTQRKDDDEDWENWE